MSDIFIGDMIEVTEAEKQYDSYASFAQFMGLGSWKGGRDIRKAASRIMVVIGKSYHPNSGSKYAPILAVEAQDGKQYLIGEDGVCKVGHILDEPKEVVSPRLIIGHSHTK